MYLWYILDDNGEPVAVDDGLTWAQWFQSHLDTRRVGFTEAPGGRVSTVFLGLDHRFTEDGPPVLWETMIFGGEGTLADYQERYTSRADALEGHARAVALATAPASRLPPGEFKAR